MSRPFSSMSSDTSLLDLETVTFEEWRTLLYNRIVQQKNIFIVDFKKKVIGDINVCMKNVKPGTTADSIQKQLVNKIDQSQFEIEYQTFVDSIVGSTFEYFCQLIIKNSMENITRTQNALNSFSLTTNINANMTKSCDESIKLPELPNLNQIQRLPETNNNNNTINSDLVVQSHLLNNNSQNVASPLVEILEKENDLNVIVNPIKIEQLHNHSQEEADFSTMELNTSNEMNIKNYVHTVQAPIDINDEDDLKTTQAIVSLAMNITNQPDTDFKYTDGFEDENTTDLKVLNTSNEIQTSSLHIQQNGDQTSSLLTQQNEEHITSPLLEDAYQITNSLKILESLVNIEHSKLEEQTSPAEKESSLSNIESKENKDKRKSKNISVREQKKDKFKKQLRKTVDDQEWKPWNMKTHKNKKRFKNESKEVQQKNRNKNKNEKSKGHNNLSNSSQINSLSSSGDIQNDQNVLLGINGVSSSNSHKKSTTKKAKSLNTDRLVGISLNSQNVKKNSPTNELKTHLGDVENITVNKKGKNTTRGSNALKTSSIVASASSCDKKNKSAHSTVSAMKTFDCKQLYEMDRKSLFNPDVIITSKPTKASMNEKNENSSTAVKRNDLSNETKKTSLKHNYCYKKKNNDKQLHSLKNTKSGTSINVIKRLRVDDLDNETNNNSKKYKKRDTTGTVENQESNNVGALIELKTEYEIKEELVTCTLDTYSTLPDWLKRKYVEYNLKPVFVVIDRDMRFD